MANHLKVTQLKVRVPIQLRSDKKAFEFESVWVKVTKGDSEEGEGIVLSGSRMKDGRCESGLRIGNIIRYKYDPTHVRGEGAPENPTFVRRVHKRNMVGTAKVPGPLRLAIAEQLARAMGPKWAR